MNAKQRERFFRSQEKQRLMRAYRKDVRGNWLRANIAYDAKIAEIRKHPSFLKFGDV